MHIHILGICGTFMGSLAVLAKDSGHKVTGSDLNCYPPISEQLDEMGIEVIPNYDPDQLKMKPDLLVIGNQSFMEEYLWPLDISLWHFLQISFFMEH